MKELAAGLQFARGWSLAVSFCDTFDPTYDVLPLSMGPVCHYREDLDVPAATLLNRPGLQETVLLSYQQCWCVQHCVVSFFDLCRWNVRVHVPT